MTEAPFHLETRDVTTAAGGSTYIGNFVFGDSGSEARRIQTWLAPQDYQQQSSRLNELRERRSSQTGSWVLEQLFPRWLDPVDDVAPARESLWLRGSVGCGKSVICSLIIDKLRDYLSAHARTTDGRDAIANILFSFEDASTCSLESVLRSILLHLCPGNSVPQEVKAMYENNPFGPRVDDFRNTLFAVLERLQAEQPSHDGDRSSSPNRSAGTRIRSLTVVIDAIDELSVDLRNTMLALVDQLHHFGQHSPQFLLRIALVSRPHEDIERICDPSAGWLRTDIPASKVDDDIKIFLRQKFEGHIKMRQQSGEDKKKLCELISQTANGMFRLASLYWAELSSYDMAEIPEEYLKRLLKTENLPSELYKFYDLILARVWPNEARADMFVILKWILIAARPMSTDELIDACATMPSKGTMFDKTRIQVCRNFAERLVGLVTVSTTSVQSPVPLGGEVQQESMVSEVRLVSLAHFSVKEYLIRRNFAEVLERPICERRLNLGQAQLYAAECCLAYLVRCKNNLDSTTDRQPWRDYAWHYWAMHAAAWEESKSDNSGNLSSASEYFNTQSTRFSLRLRNTISCPWLYPNTKRYLGSSIAKLMDLAVGVSNRYLSTFVRMSSGSIWLWIPCASLTIAVDYIKRFFGDSRESRYVGVLLEAARLDSMLTFEQHYSDILQDAEFTLSRCSLIPPRYTFSSLPDCPRTIRLLALHPSITYSSTIRCSQWTDTLDNEPVYTALSYNWSYDENRDIPILINGQLCEVRPNLEAALHELRHPDRLRILWIDALCLSMKDMAERGSQVRMMNQIYHNAEEVVVWLGPSTHVSDKIISSLDPLSYAVINVWENLEKPISEDEARSCLARLFNHEIWRKTWILLEVVLAAKVTIAWGSQRLDWSKLPDDKRVEEHRSSNHYGLSQGVEDDRNRTVVRTRRPRDIAEIHLEVPDPWPSLERMSTYQHLRKNWNSQFYLSLPELLYQTRHFTCTDPKDKIATMIHLLKPTERLKVLDWIDYNLSAVDMITSVAQYCLGELKTLDLLSINNLREVRGGLDDVPREEHLTTVYRGKLHLEARLEGLPSWVPAWHCTHWNASLSPGEFRPSQPRLYSAGGQLQDIPFDISRKTLSVKGYMVDRVAMPLKTSTLRQLEMVDFSSKALFYDSRFPRYSISVSSQPCPTSDAYGRRDAYEAFERRYLTEDAQWVALWQTMCASPGFNAPHPPVELPVSEAMNACGRFEEIVECEEERVLCASRGGRLGLIPAWALPDDLIVVLLGGSVPYIIREQPSSGEFRLVGECYIHGLMAGEALDADPEEKLMTAEALIADRKVKTFNLV